MKFWRLLTFVFLSYFGGTASAQTWDSTMDMADSARAIGDFHLAIKYYKRLLYFDQSNCTSTIQHKLANCYYQIDQWEKSLDAYQEAFISTANDSIKQNITYKRSLIFIEQKDYNRAILELSKLTPATSSDSNKKQELLLGICRFGLGEYEKSKVHFINAVTSSEEHQKINNLFSSRSMKNPKPALASILSAVMPGLGQCYSGHCKDGANSLALTTATILLMRSVIINYSIYESLVAASPWFQRYYTGGIRNAGNQALTKRNENKEDILRELILVCNSGSLTQD